MSKNKQAKKAKKKAKKEIKKMTTTKLDDGLMRQGDVLLRRIGDKAPDGFDKAKKREREKNGDKILAHGEVTGHAHRVKSLQADL